MDTVNRPAVGNRRAELVSMSLQRPNGSSAVSSLVRFRLSGVPLPAERRANTGRAAGHNRLSRFASGRTAGINPPLNRCECLSQKRKLPQVKIKKDPNLSPVYSGLSNTNFFRSLEGTGEWPDLVPLCLAVISVSWGSILQATSNSSSLEITNDLLIFLFEQM